MIFKSAFVRDKTKGQIIDYIYKWTYQDEEGNIKNKEINQVKQIQSIDYMTPKELVERGLYGNDTGLYGDFGDVPTDPIALMDYISGLQDILQDIKATESDKGNSKITESSDKVGEENKEMDNKKQEIKEGENNG